MKADFLFDRKLKARATMAFRQQAMPMPNRPLIENPCKRR